MTRALEALASTAYYLTTEPANGDRAKDLAAAHGLRVEVLFPSDLPPRADAAALVVDLDGLWLDARGHRRRLAELAANPLAAATFVHSYDFDEREGIDVDGVALARRLDDGLLGRLVALLSTATKEAA